MSRDQADQIALAVDNLHHYKLNSPTQLGLIAEPLSDLFYRNAIASGSIIPPAGESAAVRRTDYLVGLCVVCLGACGLVAMAVAYFWRG